MLACLLRVWLVLIFSSCVNLTPLSVLCVPAVQMAMRWRFCVPAAIAALNHAAATLSSSDHAGLAALSAWQSYCAREEVSNAPAETVPASGDEETAGDTSFSEDDEGEDAHNHPPSTTGRPRLLSSADARHFVRRASSALSSIGESWRRAAARGGKLRGLSNASLRRIQASVRWQCLGACGCAEGGAAFWGMCSGACRALLVGRLSLCVCVCVCVCVSFLLCADVFGSWAVLL